MNVAFSWRWLKRRKNHRMEKHRRKSFYVFRKLTISENLLYAEGEVRLRTYAETKNDSSLTPDGNCDWYNFSSDQFKPSKSWNGNKDNCQIFYPLFVIHISIIS